MKNRLGRKSPIFWSVLAFLAGLLVLAIILSFLSQAWREDFWPEFLAGLAVATAAFLVVDLLFGLTKRKEQEDRAREQARAFIDFEIAENRKLIEYGLTSWRKGEPKSINLKEDGWIDLKKSAVFPMLSQELRGILSMSYLGLKGLRNSIYLWQEMLDPDWKIQRANGTTVLAGEEMRETTIRWAESALDSLDTALKSLHE